MLEVCQLRGRLQCRTNSHTKLIRSLGLCDESSASSKSPNTYGEIRRSGFETPGMRDVDKVELVSWAQSYRHLPLVLRAHEKKLLNDTRKNKT